MQSIAAMADITEQELVDIIIDGIPDSSNAINLLYGANGIDDLVRRMDRYEYRRQQSRDVITKTAGSKQKRGIHWK